MARTNQRGRNNNNAEGRNQYSNGWMDAAKDKPFTTAAAAAAAVGAGVFLWSRRNQISDQISNLSGQLYDWADEMRTGNSERSSREFAGTEGINESSATRSNRGSTGSRSSATRSTGSAKSRGQSPTSAQNVGSERAGVETFNG